MLAAGALFLFSSWYTKKELAARISILYVAAQISGAFGGLLGSAIMSGMNGKAGLPAWRWLCKLMMSPVFQEGLLTSSFNSHHRRRGHNSHCFGCIVYTAGLPGYN